MKGHGKDRKCCSHLQLIFVRQMLFSVKRNETALISCQLFFQNSPIAMCGLSFFLFFFYYCSLRTISLFSFVDVLEVMIFDFFVVRIFFCLPKTKLWSVMVSFVNCILFQDERKLFLPFLLLVLFFIILFSCKL